MSLIQRMSLQHRHKIIAVGFTTWAMYLRIKRLAYRDLWNDELFQLKFISGPFKQFWKPIYNYGDHTGFAGDYVLTYPFVATLGTNKWVLAIPHAIFVVLGYYFLYKLCSKYFKTALAAIVPFLLVSMNNELIFHDLEFRPYAVLPTLALGSLYFMDSILAAQKLLWRDRIFAAAWLIWTCFYHAYGAPIVCVTFLFSALYHRRGQGIKQCLQHPSYQSLTVSLGIALCVWGYYAGINSFGLKPNESVSMETLTVPQSVVYTFDYFPNPMIDPSGFLRTLIGNLLGYFKPGYLALLGMAGLFWGQPHRNAQWGFLFVMIVIPLQLILLVDLKSSYWFLQRQYVWIMPWFAFLLGWIWDSFIIHLRTKFR